MLTRNTIIMAVTLVVAAILACNKQPLTVLFEGFKPAAHFPQPVYNLKNNAVTQAGFELGRKLFYDPILSANNTISCGSCHLQSSAFTQHGHNVSHGIHDKLGVRNSPPVFNLAWMPSFMWDGGIVDLDLQPVAPITNPVEMDDSMRLVIKKLQAHTQYPSLFQKAFGSQQITTANFLKALSQFMVMCVSDKAKYDSVKNGTASFTTLEQQGYEVFKQKCNSCHTEPLFTDYSFKNNGLSITAQNDQGRYAVSLLEKDKYTFKVPSLRNLTYTMPYMHDGRFNTLDAVFDHYTYQVKQTPNLHPSLKNGIPLSDDERQQLKAFLNTLNDKHFVNNTLLAEQ